MSTHLVVGLSGVGKSVVVNRVSDLHQDCLGVSYSAFAINFLMKRGIVCEREGLAATFSADVGLREDCVASLETYINNASSGSRVIVETGGALVDLQAGSMISQFTIFQNIDFCSVSVVLAAAYDIAKRVKNDSALHLYKELGEVELRRKQDDVRLYAVMMAMRKNCSLISAWNTTIDECAESLYQGMIRAEKARTLYPQK
jgi:adenylate kinase